MSGFDGKWHEALREEKGKIRVRREERMIAHLENFEVWCAHAIGMEFEDGVGGVIFTQES